MIPASVRIFVCTQPFDMRCSYDTLALAAQQVIGEDPHMIPAARTPAETLNRAAAPVRTAGTP